MLCRLIWSVVKVVKTEGWIAVVENIRHNMGRNSRGPGLRGLPIMPSVYKAALHNTFNIPGGDT